MPRLLRFSQEPASFGLRLGQDRPANGSPTGHTTLDPGSTWGDRPNMSDEQRDVVTVTFNGADKNTDYDPDALVKVQVGVRTGKH